MLTQEMHRFAWKFKEGRCGRAVHTEESTPRATTSPLAVRVTCTEPGRFPEHLICLAVCVHVDRLRPRSSQHPTCSRSGSMGDAVSPSSRGRSGSGKRAPGAGATAAAAAVPAPMPDTRIVASAAPCCAAPPAAPSAATAPADGAAAAAAAGSGAGSPGAAVLLLATNSAISRAYGCCSRQWCASSRISSPMWDT